MNLPERRTIRAVLSELAPAEQEALRDRARGYGAELPPDAPVFVTETALAARGLLRKKNPKQVRTALYVSSELVLISVTDESGVAVLHARTRDVVISQPRRLPDPRLAQRMSELQEDGVDLTGFPVSGEGTVRAGTYHLGLGAPDGDQARAAIAEHLAPAPPAG